MNLIVDFGNTHNKVAVFDQGKMVSYKVVSDSEVYSLFDQVWDGVIISSVGKDFRSENSNHLVLSHDTPVPIQNEYQTPDTLGVDRIAAAVGATYLYPDASCLVIDAGTCITYDLLVRDTFIGGIISPGLQMRLDAMNNFTKKLPLLVSVSQTTLIGKSTKECMLSGATNGLLAEMNGIIDQFQEENEGLKILLCGGDIKTFESKLKASIFVEPNLVVIGLNRILEYNAGKIS